VKEYDKRFKVGEYYGNSRSCTIRKILVVMPNYLKYQIVIDHTNQPSTITYDSNALGFSPDALEILYPVYDTPLYKAIVGEE
jgi:hypothetical protein